MFIATRALPESLGSETEFNALGLAAADGLIRARVLRVDKEGDTEGDAADERTLWTEWRDEDCCRRWRHGVDKILGDAAAWKAFAVEREESAGHRADFRSPLMDATVERAMGRESQAQRELSARARTEGLPAIHVGAFEGQILEILLRGIGARRGVEIGTLGGYSASWLARAVGPEGYVLSLEKDPRRAELAQRNLRELGFAQVEVRAGDALASLAKLDESGPDEPLDFVFIDANKSAYGDYARWAMSRLRVGGLLLADNAYIWGGMLHFGQSPQTVPVPPKGQPFSFGRGEFTGMADLWAQLASAPQFLSTVLPTGEGLAVALKISP